MHRKSKLNAIAFHVGACALGFLMIYPLLWLIASSLKSNSTMFLDTYSLIPKVWGAVENFTSGWRGIAGVPFSRFLWNSVVVTVIGTFTCVLSSMLAAYAFARIHFRLSGFWFTCVMITLMIPPQVMVVPQFVILKGLHLTDTIVALILPWCFGTAFFIFLMVQFIRGIPRSLDEAAEIDGCSKIGTLFKILVPIMKPTIMTSAIFAFYWIWQDFFQPLIFMNTTSKFTIPLALNMYLDPNSYNNYGGLFAMSLVSLLPVIIVFIIFQKYLVDGIAMDGLKG